MNEAWMNCSPGFVKNTKLVLTDLITDKPTGFTFVKSSWRFWRFDWFLAACFSKDPVTTGPDNLPGRLTGNFTGTGIAFLEAPVNFPDTYRVQ